MRVLVLVLVLLGIAACTAVSGWIVSGGHRRWRQRRGRPAPAQSSRTVAVTVVVAVALVAVGLYVENQR